MGQKLARRVRMLMLQALLRQVGRGRAVRVGRISKARQGRCGNGLQPLLRLMSLRSQCCAARCLQEVGWYDEDRNSSGVLTSKLSSDALAVKGQFGDTMGLLTQVGRYHDGEQRDRVVRCGGRWGCSFACVCAPRAAGGGLPGSVEAGRRYVGQG